MRWDDSYLYVGAYLQDTDVWANVTQHDDPHNPGDFLAAWFHLQ